MDFNTIVFVSFENQFAPCGGLTAVMRMLPPVMAKYRKTILITPFFQNIEKSKKALETGEIKTTGIHRSLLYNGSKCDIEILEHIPPTQKNKQGSTTNERNSYKIYLIKANGFFLAGSNPYIDTWRDNALFHDSYFLCKCVPYVLNAIKSDFPPPYKMNLQDWETALTVDTMNFGLQNSCVLTIHNPYDFYLPNHPQGKTILQHTIPKMHGLSTVSEHYAYELMHDVLQKDCFTWKLQKDFMNIGIIGINNGNFVELNFPETLKNPEEILAEKKKNRMIFSKLLNSRDDLKPTWGNRVDFIKDDNPIYLLFGRDEPIQKGFDAAAAAIYKLLKRRGTDIGYFIFTPIPGVYGLNNLAYFEDLCREFGNNVLVFPFRLSAGYMELQRAANYIIMPSFYEPFGAANEGYAGGTPVIARATGGLIQQVCPINFQDLPETTKRYVEQYHKGSLSNPTGFLYREHPNTETAENWNYLMSTNYTARRTIQEPVDWRNPVFWSMVVELEKVLEQSSDYYKSNKEGYCKMIRNGIELFKTFSWEKSAEKYMKELYKMEI